VIPVQIRACIRDPVLASRHLVREDDNRRLLASGGRVNSGVNCQYRVRCPLLVRRTIIGAKGGVSFYCFTVA
jgi:hypothetical protein